MEFEYIVMSIFSKTTTMKMFTQKDYEEHILKYPQDTDKYKIVNTFNRHCHLTMIVPRYVYYIP